MITYQHLLHADFSGLKTAADTWATVPKELGGAGGVRQEFDKVSKGLSDGTWEGSAADAAQPVMASVATEIDRAGDEAHGIAKLLSDAHTEFTASQKALKNIVGDVTSENSSFTISDSGTVTPRPGGDPRLAQSAWQTADGYNASVQQLLQDATKTDQTLRWALRDDTDGAKDQGFSDLEFGSIADAEAGRTKSLRDARAAAKLAKNRPLTKDDARRLDALLAGHTGDPAFGAAFATGLGVDGTLDLWTSVGNPVAEQEIGKDTLKSLQSDMGFTLAAATHEHTPAMAEWQKQMVAAATRPVPGSPNLLGSQVMSNLMRTGDYDKGFLAPYGHAVLKFDEAHKDMGYQWGAQTGLNYLGGSPSDPLEGYMEALDHNPGYATEFLNEKGTFHHLATRKWYDHGTSLGHAVLAGTTGHPAGTPAGSPFPAHTAPQAKLMEAVTGEYSADVTKPVDSGLAPSLGRMIAEYMPDIDRAVSPYNPGDLAPEDRKPAGTDLDSRYYPAAGSPATLSSNEATRLLYRLGRSPSAYAPIVVAQTQYTSGAMVYHAHNPGLVRDGLDTQINLIATSGASVQAIVNQGAAHQKFDSTAAKDAAYNQSLSHEGEYAKAFVGFGAGFAEAIPVAGGLTGGLLEAAGNNAVDTYVSGHQQDNTPGETNTAGAAYLHSVTTFQNSVTDGALAGGIAHQTHQSPDQFRDGLGQAFSNGNGRGKDLLSDAQIRGNK